MHWLHAREPVSAWTHFAWMALALPGTWYLWRHCGADRLKRVGTMVFGVALTFCYAGSFLYHSVPESMEDACALIDHIGIYLLIAGTVTPVGLVVLRGWWRVGLLGGIWLLALLGIAMRLSGDLPTRALTVSYLFMGWIGIATYSELGRYLSRRRTRFLWLGGLFYSLGAVLNVLHWPTFYHGVFGSHELFHLFVMVGTACHYWFILTVVLPYRRVEVPPAVRPAFRHQPSRSGLPA